MDRTKKMPVDQSQQRLDRWITVVLTKNDKQRLLRIANQQGRGITQMARWAIICYLDGLEQPRPPK